MGSIGWTELIVILGAALLIFGPGKLPEVGATLGKAIREFKGAVNNIDADIKKEVNDIKEGVGDIKSEVDFVKEATDVKSVMKDLEKDLKATVNAEPAKEQPKAEAEPVKDEEPKVEAEQAKAEA